MTILESDRIKDKKHLPQILAGKPVSVPGKKSDEGVNLTQTGQGKRQS
jgi:hypothetical protein